MISGKRAFEMSSRGSEEEISEDRTVHQRIFGLFPSGIIFHKLHHACTKEEGE
jgi:hypothetical protein